MSAVLNLVRDGKMSDAAHKRYLLVGAGSSHDKRIAMPESPSKDWSDGELVTLDADPDLNPNVVWDLDKLPYTFAQDNEFSEIHAYEVLEHCGTQGDGKFFFGQFAEFWRMLKPDGLFCLSVPLWHDQMAWGVPDHKRVLPANIFGFLDVTYYDNLGKPGFADYRKWLGKTNFQVIGMEEKGDSLYLVMKAIK